MSIEIISNYQQQVENAIADLLGLEEQFSFGRLTPNKTYGLISLSSDEWDGQSLPNAYVPEQYKKYRLLYDLLLVKCFDNSTKLSQSFLNKQIITALLSTRQALTQASGNLAEEFADNEIPFYACYPHSSFRVSAIAQQNAPPHHYEITFLGGFVCEWQLLYDLDGNLACGC